MRAPALLLAMAACAGPDARVGEVRALGPMAAPPEMLGRDGGVSGSFGGRSVWVYGDGVARDAGTYPNTWRNNSMSYTEDRDASDGLDGWVQPTDALGAAREFFPRTAEEASFNEAHLDDGDCAEPCGARYAVWGGGPVEIEAGRAFLSYAVIYAEPGEWNFHPVGQSLATWEDPDLSPERPPSVGREDGAVWLFDSAVEGEFGPGLHVKDGFVAMYSCSGGPWADRQCRLARAPVEEALDRGSWRFFDGEGWVEEVADAAALFEAGPNVTVEYNAYLERWVAIYLDWGAIHARTAPAPEGPWSRPFVVYVPREEGAIHAAGHAELDREGGALGYVSYLADQFYLIEIAWERR